VEKLKNNNNTNKKQSLYINSASLLATGLTAAYSITLVHSKRYRIAATTAATQLEVSHRWGVKLKL